MLPQFQSDDRDFQLMQSAWATQLNPLIAAPFAQGVFLENVSLATGLNSINHKLGHPLRGWIVTRLKASATLFDTQDTNVTPSVTLDLNASAPVVVSLFVF